MCRHRLSILQSSAGFKIRGDPGRPKCVAANPHARSEIGGASLDHAPGVDAVHRLFGQDAGAADRRAEEGSLAVVADFRGVDVGGSRPKNCRSLPMARVFIE